MISTIFILFISGCTKDELINTTPEAALAKKRVSTLSETWINGSLAEKYEYAGGRLVRAKSGGMDLVYTYTDRDHYTIMTGDYMYAHFYYNEDHQLTKMELGNEDGQSSIWVRHTFTWAKDRIQKHTWASGDLSGGTFVVLEYNYIYRNALDLKIESYSLSYKDGQMISREYIGTVYYNWHTPFGCIIRSDSHNYEFNVFSNTIKMPHYNIASFPWGHYSINDSRKRDLMNMVATHWSRNYISGMLLLEKVKVADGQKLEITHVRNIVVNQDKLPVSYDLVNGLTNVVNHYEFKYITL